MIDTLWRYISGYEGLYSISAMGEIISLHRRSSGRIITPRVDRAGYYTVRLSKDGCTKTHYVHRLVALTFIPRTEGLTWVNHIDGKKLNNDLDNLKWCSPSENTLHYYRDLDIRGGWQKYKYIHNLQTGEDYKTLKEASHATGIPYSTLRGYLSGKRKNPTPMMYFYFHWQLPSPGL